MLCLRTRIEGYNDEDEDEPIMGVKLDSRGRMQPGAHNKAPLALISSDLGRLKVVFGLPDRLSHGAGRPRDM